jgi:pilus assembly protein CpaC
MRLKTSILVACCVLMLAWAAYAQTAPLQTPAGTQNPPAAEAGQSTAPAQAEPPQPQTQAPAPQPAVQAPITQAPEQVSPTGAAPLRVMVGKSLLINTTDRLKRVAVTDPAIADAVVVTPNQVLVHGRSPGEVSLILWDAAERSRSFDLRVDVDTTAASEEIKRIFPDEPINVSASRSAIVLSGHVANENDAKRASAIAEAFSKNVVNVLTFGPVGAQEVLLEVKFAEVDRTALTQLGVNIFSTGAGNMIGNTTTQQFGGTQVPTISDQFGVRAHPFPNTVQPTTGSSTNTFTSTLNFNDILNVFLFRPDIHLGAVIKALQQKNLLQILAEPNLIAVNGKEASFLAGGEFPYPVVQPGQGFAAVTIQFREFGVRLRFTPMIMPNGNIHLAVKPEVSALDFANALTISGFVVPALSTRRAETELEIQDGQSFVIAGLLDNRLTSISSKVPGLGDIPVLGTLFKSKNLQKSKSELMVLVTARRISPANAAPPAPTMPQQFLDPKKFDGAKPASGTPGQK